MKRHMSDAQDISSKRAAERESRQHEILMARLDAELATERRRLAPKELPALPSAEEELARDLAADKARYLLPRRMIAKEIEQAEKDFADNPEELARIKAVLQDWCSRHS